MTMTTTRLTMTYGAKCQPIMKPHMQQISVAKMRMLRWMSGKTRIDRITNECIRGHFWAVPMGNKRRPKETH